MDQNLCRWLMLRPKFRRSRTTAAAAPAAFRLVHLKIVGREQMAIAADTMAMGSRIRSKEKHTTPVLVAAKHALATIFKSITYNSGTQIAVYNPAETLSAQYGRVTTEKWQYGGCL
jgi:hypothetical protein